MWHKVKEKCNRFHSRFALFHLLDYNLTLYMCNRLQYSAAELFISSITQVSRQEMGHERSPILIYDDFFPEPVSLRQTAAGSFFVNGGEVYPGIRASLPSEYFRILSEKLVPSIEPVFVGTVLDGFENCTYSMVTTPPDKLKLNQCFPHTDENDENYLAFIHYLCDERLGGTNFFRHKPSGYERITMERAPRYNAAMGNVIREKMQSSYTPLYFSEDDALFERIFSAKNKFNRLVVYSGANLHSGDIPHPESLSEDPASGRLTITGFIPLTPHTQT